MQECGVKISGRKTNDSSKERGTGEVSRADKTA
jgi:hypothetical protein